MNLRDENGVILPLPTTLEGLLEERLIIESRVQDIREQITNAIRIDPNNTDAKYIEWLTRAECALKHAKRRLKGIEVELIKLKAARDSTFDSVFVKVAKRVLLTELFYDIVDEVKRTIAGKGHTT